jgi:probable phosphoglycerate mutase
MKKLPTIILVRHGQTEWNVEGRYQGRLNSDLTEKGKEQSKRNASKIAKVLDLNKPFKIFSSPLGRAKESCHIICDELGIDKNKIIFDERISEFNYGIFEGKTKEECKELYPQVLAQREAHKWSYQIENGESYLLVTERLKSWLQSVSSEEVVLMVAHEMVNRALRGIYCDLDSNSMLALRQANDLVLKLENSEENIIE